jgi:phosphate transport system substrate-binding protein
MVEYLDEFTSEKAWGEDGHLSLKGIILMPDPERQELRSNVNNLKTLKK